MCTNFNIKVILELYNNEKIDIITNKTLDYSKFLAIYNIVFNRSLINIIIIFELLKILIIEIK